MKNNIEERLEHVFDHNFADFWIDFLSHNVFRSRMLIQQIGNINDSLIIQAISWHHYLLMIHDSKKDTAKSFNNALKMIQTWSAIYSYDILSNKRCYIV